MPFLDYILDAANQLAATGVDNDIATCAIVTCERWMRNGMRILCTSSKLTRSEL